MLYFRTDCPDGKLTTDHLRKLFKQAFPEGEETFVRIDSFFTIQEFTMFYAGNGEEFSSHILRLFDSDGNGYLVS